jgi:hypothetical protein
MTRPKKDASFVHLSRCMPQNWLAYLSRVASPPARPPPPIWWWWYRTNHTKSNKRTKEWMTVKEWMKATNEIDFMILCVFLLSHRIPKFQLHFNATACNVQLKWMAFKCEVGKQAARRPLVLFLLVHYMLLATATLPDWRRRRRIKVKICIKIIIKWNISLE